MNPEDAPEVDVGTPMVAGLDVGSHAVKATLVRGVKVLANVAIPLGLNNPERIGREVIDKAMRKSGVIDIPCRIFVTGSGKSLISFADDTISEAVCLCKGIHEVLPSGKTIVDLGAQKSLIVKCSDGYPVKMVTSDKCASGSGSYLQVIADVLEMDVEEVGPASLGSTEIIQINSTCAVFAESETISLLHSGTEPADILKAVYRSLANRLHSLLLRVGVEPIIALVGGMATDVGLQRAIEEEVGEAVVVPSESVFLGSLGAARIGQER